MPKSYEDELQLLIDKVEGADDKSWEEMVSELGLSVHPDSLRKSFNQSLFKPLNNNSSDLLLAIFFAIFVLSISSFFNSIQGI